MKLQRLDEYVQYYANSLPNKEAVVDGDLRLTYADLDERTNRAAQGFRDLGVERGDVVGTLLGNRWQSVVTLLAASRLGATFSALNTRHSVETTAGMLDRADCSLLVADVDQVAELSGRIPGVTAVTAHEESADAAGTFDDLLETYPAERPNADVNFDDAAWIHWTSGTTGEPKGCLRTQYQLIQYGWTWLPFTGYNREDRALQFAPLFGVGFSNLLIPMLIVGGTDVLMADFDAEEALDLVEQEDITALIGVPTHYKYLTDAADGTRDVGSVERCVQGGGHLSRELAGAVLDTFDARLANGYGTSEEGVVLYEEITRPLSETTAFQVVPGAQAKVDAEEGEPGELLVKAPIRMERYLDTEEPPVVEDGLRSTGDMFDTVEPGVFRYVGRSDDMIVSGGFNIYPIEVESALRDHPDVEDAAVIGVPDDDLGHTVKAHVVSDRPDRDALEANLDEFCQDHEELADFKRPRQYAFHDELPKTTVGKIDRSQLE